MEPRATSSAAAALAESACGQLYAVISSIKNTPDTVFDIDFAIGAGAPQTLRTRSIESKTKMHAAMLQIAPDDQLVRAPSPVLGNVRVPSPDVAAAPPSYSRLYVSIVFDNDYMLKCWFVHENGHLKSCEYILSTYDYVAANSIKIVDEHAALLQDKLARISRDFFDHGLVDAFIRDHCFRDIRGNVYEYLRAPISELRRRLLADLERRLNTLFLHVAGILDAYINKQTPPNDSYDVHTEFKKSIYKGFYKQVRDLGTFVYTEMKKGVSANLDREFVDLQLHLILEQCYVHTDMYINSLLKRLSTLALITRRPRHLFEGIRMRVARAHRVRDLPATPPSSAPQPGSDGKSPDALKLNT